MTKIVYLIESVAPGLYLICAFGILLSMRLLMTSRGELRIAEFELERELARRRQADAITRTIGLIEVALAIFAIANVVAPTMRADVVPDAASVNIAPTYAPFHTSTPAGAGGAAPGAANPIDSLMLTVTAKAASDSGGGVTILATPTISPTPVGTINPDAPKVLGCDTPNATLEVPANGQVVFDSLTVIGTAFTSNFSVYKFEFNGPSTGNAFTPYGGDKTVAVTQKGVLGQLSLNGFQPGAYEFRLTVFDNTQSLRASCMVNIDIVERPPTATPPGGSK
jgi:hypothetical protein